VPYQTVQALPLNLREILSTYAQEIFVKSFTAFFVNNQTFQMLLRAGI
jgi:cation transport regulator ChaB